MRLSIVATLYHSAPYIREFYARTWVAAEQITDDFEMVFVNDGSPDDSLGVALALQQDDPRIKVIDLSRNFGHHKAIMTGLAHTSGDLIFLIDCDLEEEPELLTRFFAEMTKTSADVVFGVQKRRRGSLVDRLTGWLFWKLFNAFSSYPVRPNQLVARLMTRDYVASLVLHHDQLPFLPGLWAITGFRQVPLAVRKTVKGSSTYTLRRKMAQVVHAITSFSNRPLIYIFYMGLLIEIISGIAAAYLVLMKLLVLNYQAGWASLIVSIWLLGGLTILSLGIIGIYLSTLFIEVKQRPYTIIRKIYETGKGAAQDGVRQDQAVRGRLLQQDH